MSEPDRSTPIRLATRGSTLALWQARHVAEQLGAADTRLVVVRTTGDRHTDAPFSAIGTTGLFTKEVDHAVLAGDADAAVHSLKDLPTQIDDGLRIAAVLRRSDPRDAFLASPGAARSLALLAPGARVGTSSLRRRALLAALRPDLHAVELRGNVDTRVAKLQAGEIDAAVLAAAGLIRLGLEARICELLEPPAWLPAPGQGALAIVTRDDDAAASPFGSLDHEPTHAAVRAERAFLRALEGGCQVPIGALATVDDDRMLTLHGFLGDDRSGECAMGTQSGPAAHAGDIGESLARAIAADAGEILHEMRMRTRGNGVPRPASP